ncbi:MAG: AraC family transcriptional regulator [Piscirickettsiaceae bacterium]|nr:AraC family transcriptional regulator [Piscirickettsiaceae bacterium]
MDVLSDVLKLLRLKASVYFHANFCGSWSLSSPESNIAKFHIVERGTCWLHMPHGEQAITLRSGDLIFFPRDAKHIITDTSEPLSKVLEPGIISDPAATGPTTKIICGSFQFESGLVNPILNALPDVVHIKSDDPDNTAWLDPLMRFIYQETENESLGSAAVVDKLCDVLFVQIIKSWINKKETVSGFLAALADSQLYRALQQFHASPTSVWTVELLAEQAGMSRSAFAKRFQLIMGITPMYYVAHWRMQCAHELLITTNKSIAQIADDFTYQSEASFRKAFKQHMGTPPGAVRKSKSTNSE